VFGTRALTVATAIATASRQLGARRLALAMPYPEVIAAAGRTYWTTAGFEIVAHRGLEGVTNIYEETEERVARSRC
jgi:maleate cis-trans isomerase